MKYFLLLIITLLIGCSPKGEQDLTLICDGDTRVFHSNLITKKGSEERIEHHRKIYKILNGKYGTSECKFTKEEIFCDTSNQERLSAGNLRFSRDTRLIQDGLDTDIKNSDGQIYIRDTFMYFGKCEI
jgi:hypothetical protein